MRRSTISVYPKYSYDIRPGRDISPKPDDRINKTIKTIDQILLPERIDEKHFFYVIDQKVDIWMLSITLLYQNEWKNFLEVLALIHKFNGEQT